VGTIYARRVKVEERFAEIVTALEREPDTGMARMFGAGGLATRGKYFAMLYKGRLVVKLPRERVDELVSAGEGEHWDPGHGRRMKEWLAVDENSSIDWLKLSREAHAFVGAKK
jgi:TfoX/Sxy family transcriptional regulator of competence genes